MSDSKRYAVAIHDGRGWHTVLTTSSVAVADHSAQLLLQWTMYCDDDARHRSATREEGMIDNWRILTNVWLALLEAANGRRPRADIMYRDLLRGTPGEPLQGEVWHSHGHTSIWPLLYPMGSWRAYPLWGEILAPGTLWIARHFYDGERWSAKWVGGIYTYSLFGPLL